MPIDLYSSDSIASKALSPTPVGSLFTILFKLIASFLLPISFKKAIISFISCLLKNLNWSTKAKEKSAPSLDNIFSMFLLSSTLYLLSLVSTAILFKSSPLACSLLISSTMNLASSMELFKALYLIFSPSASVKAFISSLYISFTSFSKAFFKYDKDASVRFLVAL